MKISSSFEYALFKMAVQMWMFFNSVCIKYEITNYFPLFFFPTNIKEMVMQCNATKCDHLLSTYQSACYSPEFSLSFTIESFVLKIQINTFHLRSSNQISISWYSYYFSIKNIYESKECSASCQYARQVKIIIS